MRKFAEEWTDFQIVQRVAAQIPWCSNLILLDKIGNSEDRIWYANKALESGERYMY